jgi:hypothetical protein
LFAIFGKLNLLANIIIAVILVILFTAVISSIIVRKKYKEIGQTLNDIKKGLKVSDKHNVIDIIIRDYRASLEENTKEINTQAIIEKNFNNELKGLYTAERFIKHSVSLMIILGLLGTFYGLTLSIGDLVKLLSNSGNTEVMSSVDSIVGGLISSVKGMSVAFVTSLFGIGSSIILTVFNIFNNIVETRESIMVEIEEYLDNKLAAELNKDKVDDHTLLVNAMEAALEKFGMGLDKQLRNLLDFSGQNLAATAKEMENSSLSLLKSVSLFDKSLENFRENTRDFSEFNYNLRTNIERMNVTFADFIEDLKNVNREK